MVTLVKAIVRFSFGENFRNVESHVFFGGGGGEGRSIGGIEKNSHSCYLKCMLNMAEYCNFEAKLTASILH